MFLFLVSLIGLCVGSFLNVVIYRVPIMLENEWRQKNKSPEKKPFNLLQPRSHCPHCRHTLSILDNIPLISFCLLRGRCKYCRHKISLRYPLIELISAISAGIIIFYFGFTVQSVCALLLTWSLIALAVIDIKTQLLPDSITLPLLWLGLLASLFNIFVSSFDAIIGAAIGYLTLWLVNRLFKCITGKTGMGNGDFKLLAMLGAWVGWQQLPFILLCSSFLGSIIGVTLILVKKSNRLTPIPFGPFLAFAGWISLLWGPAISSWYWQLIN